MLYLFTLLTPAKIANYINNCQTKSKKQSCITRVGCFLNLCLNPCLSLSCRGNTAGLCISTGKKLSLHLG